MEAIIIKHLGDITKIHNAPPVDIVTGGSPCQDLSIAGKRAGLAGERSGLFMEQIRIVKEIRNNGSTNRRADELVRPGRFLVWENVYGAFSSNNGEDFRVVLEEMCRIKDPNANVPRPTNGKWAKAGLIMGDGYSVGWRLHDAQYHGVPQRRRRLCVLADLDGDAAGRILFELRRKTASGELIETFGYLGEESQSEVQSVSESMPRNSEQGEQERQGASADATGCIGETGSITFQERAGKPGGGKGLLIQTERAGALACHPQNVCFNSWDVQSKHIQPESGVAETLYSGECRYGGGESYVLQEQKVGVLNDQGGDVIGTSEEKTGTLRAEDHGHPPVVYGLSPYDSNAMKSDNPKAGIYEADTARTLDLNGASPVCNQGGMAVVYQGASVTSPVNASNPQPGDPRHSITTDSRNYVVETKVFDGSRRHDYKPFGDVCETVQAAYGTGGNNVPMVVEGADLYNQELTGEVAATMNASSCGSPTASGPSVCVHPKVYDARGNGDGKTVPTLTGDHENRITDYSAICVDQGAGKSNCVVQKMWNGDDVSPTLTANNANGGQRMPDKDNFNAVVSFGVDCYNQSMSEEQSKALNSAATDSDHIPCTYGLDRASYNQGKNAKYNISIEEEKIGSMVAKGPGAMCARDYKGVGSVRRLTPLECTRLQGYPDGWVDIGDWVDLNGKSHKDADSPKYKALGNSIALPWWQGLAYRIVAELKRSGVSDPTMGSLFSGIGGFEFVFTKAGCTPVWSSEIEEFCIAVTEKHFGNDEKGIIGDVERYL